MKISSPADSGHPHLSFWQHIGPTIASIALPMLLVGGIFTVVRLARGLGVRVAIVVALLVLGTAFLLVDTPVGLRR